MKRSVLKAAAAAFFLFASSAGAQLVFDNGAPAGGQARVSDFTRHSSASGLFFQVADDFSLAAPASIGSVRWWGEYWFDDVAAADDFTLRIFASEGGAPAITPLYEQHLGAALTRTAYAGDIFQYDAALAPVALGSGTYFLSVVNRTAEDDVLDSWFWVSSTAAGAGSAYNRAGATLLDAEGAAWGTLGFDFAFQVSAVPEPQTYALLLAGLGLLGFAARRRVT